MKSPSLASLGLFALACSGAAMKHPEAGEIQKEAPRLVENQERPFMLPDSAKPEHYGLKLRMDPSAERFSGLVEIDVVLSRPTTALVLHGRGLKVEQATILAGTALFDARASERAGADPRGEPDLLVLEVEKPVSGKVQVRIQYSAPYRTDMRGPYRTAVDGKNYVFTQFQPMDARSAFPCFDEPHHKTPFTVSLEVPRGNLAVSSMPEKSRQEEGPWVRYDFETSPPLSTYLLAWAVGDLEVRPQGETNGHPKIRIVTTAGRSARGDLALREARAHLTYLESYFQSPYPYPKLDILAVPEFGAFAMENVGLVAFREEALLVTEDSPIFAQRLMSGVMAHELSHMWFGNLVTLSWWDELWLNEAFATWMSNKAMAAIRPQFHAREDFLGWLGGAMWEDSLPTARAIRQSVKTQTDSFRAFSGITYAKGASVLDMTEEWVGKEAFQKGIVRYLDLFAWKTATSEDLFAVLGSKDHPVRKVVSSFTTQSGVPLLRVKAECQNDTVSLRVEQTPFFALGSDHRHLEGREWMVPLCVLLGGPNGRTKECHLLTDLAQSFPSKVTECPTWIHPNVDLNGYYHSALDVSELEKLVRLSPSELSPREQVGVMRSMNVGAEAGSLELGTFLRLGEIMLKEPARRQAVWDELLSNLYFLDTHLVEPGQRRAFEDFVGRLVAPALVRLGLEGGADEPPETKGFRSSLVSAAGRLARDQKVRAWSLAVVRGFLASSAPGSRELVQLALPIAVRENDRAIFDGLVALSRATKIAEDRVLILEALGNTTDPELVQVLLGSVLKKELLAGDARHVLRGLLWEPAHRELTGPWFRNHFDDLTKIMPVLALRDLVSAALDRCTLEDRDEIEATFRPRLAKLEGMDEVLAESRESAARCVAYKEHHESSLSRFLTPPLKRATP